MPTVNPSPFGPKPQFEIAAGTPAVGNKLFFYVGGSVNTKRNTYTDSTGAVANPNPIVLNSLGQPTNEIWFESGLLYKVVYAPSTDPDPPTSPIWSVDNIRGINDTTVGQDQWVASGLTPTFINTTSFSLAGDQTANFHIGRRLKTTNSGGTIYSRITNSVFGALTTVTVVNDAGVLDSGLSAVSYGILTATNGSIPGVTMSGANWTFAGNAQVAGTLGVTGAATAASLTVTTGAISQFVTNSLVTISGGTAGNGGSLLVTGSTHATLPNYAIIRGDTISLEKADSTNRATLNATGFTVVGALAVNGNTTLGDAAADNLTINAETVSQPNIPCFLAVNSATDVDQTGTAEEPTIDHDTEIFDQSGDFAADTFTAPATGRYLLSVQVTVSDLAVAMNVFNIVIQTSNRTYRLDTREHVETAGDRWSGSLTVIADMDAADTAFSRMMINGGAGATADIVGGANSTYFCGVRVA